MAKSYFSDFFLNTVFYDSFQLTKSGVNLHKNVKTLSYEFLATSNFEVQARDIVITKVTNTLAMVTAIPLMNIEEEQNIDSATAKQIVKIIEFLLNIED
jgi:hypothetical protein